MNDTPIDKTVSLRTVQTEDLPIFFEHQLDPQARYMTGFAPETPDYVSFLERWSNILSNENYTIRTILYEEAVAGNVLSFVYGELPHVGYWLGREYWGKGIVSQALAQLLTIVTVRPIYARVLKDNLGSRRVLEKCGFLIISEGTAMSNTRHVEIEEFVCRLD